VPPAGMPVTVAVTARVGATDSDTDPIGHAPSTRRSIVPANRARSPKNARPAANAARRSGSEVVGAHAHVRKFLVPVRQFFPLWSSLTPLPVRNSALREHTSHAARWRDRVIPAALR
jgi:hypothetical protein